VQPIIFSRNLAIPSGKGVRPQPALKRGFENVNSAQREARYVCGLRDVLYLVGGAEAPLKGRMAAQHSAPAGKPGWTGRDRKQRTLKLDGSGPCADSCQLVPRPISCDSSLLLWDQPAKRLGRFRSRLPDIQAGPMHRLDPHQRGGVHVRRIPTSPSISEGSWLSGISPSSATGATSATVAGLCKASEGIGSWWLGQCRSRPMRCNSKTIL